MSDATGDTYWGYDNRGQLAAEVRVLNNNRSAYVTQWAYNASGMMKSMTYPGDNQGNTGESVVYGYHNQMSLSTISASPPYSQTYLASTAYDAAGRVVRRGEHRSPALGGGVTNSYAYYLWTSQGGRLQSIASAAGGQNLLSLG